VIGLRLTVPIACWRKGMAREYLETEAIPPPATCYGALLSLVGETERERHQDCRVTGGIIGKPSKSTVLRTVWRIKDKSTSQGNAENARPDFQELNVGAEVVIWCDSSQEQDQQHTLESRVRGTLKDPSSVTRFGGWSLGESTHLINDCWPLPETAMPPDCHVFVVDSSGDVTLPVWVDHVGTAGTRQCVGRIVVLERALAIADLPRISPV